MVSRKFSTTINIHNTDNPSPSLPFAKGRGKLEEFPFAKEREKVQQIALFGSTGSIGVNTLDVIRRNPGRYAARYLTANSQVDLLEAQIAEFHPSAVAVRDAEAWSTLRRRNPKCEVLCGDDGILELARRNDYDILVGALVGFAGLKSTVEAVKLGKRICLANKETLVVAGELLTALAAQSGSEIIPIDSEHSAIYQCLVGESNEYVRRIILTASGGPFRTWPKESFNEITVEKALRHPKWVMGRKITIDSATLMNKGLEVIEAKWLFGQPLEKIEVVVHPQSIVHSLVEFIDGSIKAQLGAPDMRLPIQYALSAPERLNESYDRLDLLTAGPLEFEAPDTEKFPCLRLAREAGEKGGLYPCILNAANEIAVHAFLEKKIAFTEIPELIASALNAAPPSADAPFTSDIEKELQRIFKADAETRSRY
jgi:1-deoxy-D-xylulose-5-phosphate reductoisomerase